MNGAVGVPVALASLVFAREILRAMAAAALGFRVFEIQWGVGRAIAKRALGPLAFTVSRIPLAGVTVARSGAPKRHRLVRAACALSPLALQLSWLAYRSIVSGPLSTGMAGGPNILGAFDLANVLLITLHLTLPMELSAGVRTDVRLFLDAVLGHADSNRAARASYYARLAHHHLERADLDRAERSLSQGLVQLGREPMLVACETRFRESDLTSVIDQGECADDWKRMIDEGEPRRGVERASWSFGDHLRETIISAAPLALVAITLSAVHADRFALVIEGRLRSASEYAASKGDANQCAAMIERWTAWVDWADRWQAPEATKNRDRHLGLSRLEHCRGALAAAAAHHGEALLAANRARSTLVTTRVSDPARWLENELSMADLLHHAALVENDRNAFRNALVSLGQAEKRLATLSHQVQLLSEPEARDHARASIEEQRDELLTARSHVLASMSRR